MCPRRVRGTPAATSYLGPSRDAGAAPSRFPGDIRGKLPGHGKQ